MKITDVLKILGDENRIRIISLLYRSCLCVCELEYITCIEQSNLSKHLSKLYLCGFLELEKKAQWNYYKLSESFMKRFPFIVNLINEEFSKMDEVRKDHAAYEQYKKEGIGCEGIRRRKECRKN